MQLSEDEEQDSGCEARVQEQFKEWEKHWQVEHEAQRIQKPWEDKHTTSAEDTMPNLRAADLKRAAATYKPAQESGVTVFTGSCRMKCVRERLFSWKKVQSAGIWPNRALTTTFFDALACHE